MLHAKTALTHSVRRLSMVLLVFLAFSSQAEDLDKYRYQPDKDITKKNPLEGQDRKDFDCFDKNQDGKIDEGELKRRKVCLNKSRLEAMQLDVRPGIIMERLDADGDRLIGPREYKTWTQVSE